MSTLQYHKYAVEHLTRFFDMVGPTYLEDAQITIAIHLHIQVDPEECVMERLMHLERAAAKRSAEK